MTAAIAIALIKELLANLPAVIQTGSQVVSLIQRAVAQLTDAIGDKDVTAEEVDALIAQIVANSAQIQAID